MPSNAELTDANENLKSELEELKAKLAEAKARPPAPPVAANPQRHDLDTFKDGSFKRRSNNEVFQLRKLKPDEANANRTHQLANAEHFMELTEDDFRLQFDADK